MLGLVLFVAAGAAWNWNRLVHLPDPDIVIRTESEALAGAREFLAAARIGTSDYDISHASYITSDRMKGRICWCIFWLAKPEARNTNKLSVLVSETGWCHANKMISTNQGVEINGFKTNPFNFYIERSAYILTRLKEGGTLRTPIHSPLGDDEK